MLPDRFQTERTILKPLEVDDVEELQSYLNAPGMIGCRCLPWEIRDVAPLSRARVEEALAAWAKEKKGFALGIALRETGELIGHATCDWHWDPHAPGIAVAVSPLRRRRGIGSEVARHLVSYLFENTAAHNVSGWISSWNEAGLAFAAALGFRESGRIPRSEIRDGSYHEGVLVDLLKPEWRKLERERHGA